MRFRVPHCGLDRAFGHVVAANRFKAVPDIGGGGKLAFLKDRPDEVAQNLPSSLNGFRRVEWAFARHTFAPAGHAIGLGFHDQHAAVGNAAKAGLKWRYQRHSDFTKYQFL